MTIIENEYLKVAISPKGAQLSSLFNKATQTEQLWQADENVWPWHAPNLFPIVGGLVNNELHVDGQTYHLPRHGFARHSEFEVVESKQQHAVFSLAANAQTEAVYPYQFAFQVLYDLIDNALRITYKVINLDNKAIYFSVGGHPAFNIPFGKDDNFEDYYLEFELNEKLETHLLNKDGYLTGETQSVELNGKNLFLTRHLFDADALVFHNIRSKMITIRSTKHDQSLSIEYPHFKHLGIWGKPGANFVCVEPWLGYADAAGADTNISNKPGIQKLDKGHVFEASYYLSV